MEKLAIWYVVSEAEGLVKSGGLADVAKALPKALVDLEHEASIVIPAYASISNIAQAPVILSTQLEHWPYTPYKVKQLSLDGVAVYALECESYFSRSQLYAENNQAYQDNGERFAFFSCAALDCLPKLDKQVDVVHANDWHTGLVPFLLQTRYSNDKRYQGISSVLTVHNAIFQGIFTYQELNIIPELQQVDKTLFQVSINHISTLKAGIAYADKINAVSPNYAAELITPLGSHGLYDDFMRRKSDLIGILNGCDYRDWTPEQDCYIPQQYTANEKSMLAGKKAAKHELQNEYQLLERDVPLFGMVCRLSHQKGFHYLIPILDQFLQSDVQLVILGTGDPRIAQELKIHAAAHRDKFCFIEKYSNRLAHLIEAGSDFFLMPSEFEACGLNQLYSMAYGTLPIVREVGGLKDTVFDVDREGDKASGFTFQYPYSNDLLITMQRALLFYLQQPEKLNKVRLQAMRKDFRWIHSARNYVEMYYTALKRVRSCS